MELRKVKSREEALYLLEKYKEQSVFFSEELLYGGLIYLDTDRFILPARDFLLQGEKTKLGMKILAYYKIINKEPVRIFDKQSELFEDRKILISLN